jgi:hypothetical protein
MKQVERVIEIYQEPADENGHTITTDRIVEIKGAERRVIASGLHTFFRCSWTPRIRWALRNWADDGVALRTHGAAATLEDAARDAHKVHRMREACKR